MTAAEHRAMPHLRWWLDTPPFSLSTVEAGASPLQRVLVTPRDTRAMRRFYRDQFPEVDPPAGLSAWRGTRVARGRRGGLRAPVSARACERRALRGGPDRLRATCWLVSHARSRDT